MREEIIAPESTRRPYASLGIVCAAIVCVFGAIAWIAVKVPTGAKLTAVLVMVLAGSAAMVLFRTKASPVGPGKLLGGVLLWFFAVAPVLQLSSGRFSMYHLDDPHSTFVFAAVMTALYGWAFAVGLRLASASRMAPRAHAGTVVRRTRVLVIGYIIVGAIGWLVYFRAMGGFVTYLGNLQNRTQLSAGLGYVFLVANLFQVGGVIATACEATGRRVIPRWMTVLVVSGAFLVIMVMGMRSRALMYLAIIVIVHYVAGTRVSRVSLLVAATVGVLIIAAAGRLRLLGSGTGAIFDPDEVVAAISDGGGLVENAVIDYGHFDRLSLIYEYVPRRLDYQLGATMAAVALMPVPRKWFPDKPTGSGPLLANAFRPGAWDLEAGWTSGQTPTIMGELFLNFSWLGLLGGGLLLGVIAGRVYRAWAARGDRMWGGMQYAIFGTLFVVAGTLGEFYGTIIMYAAYALPVAVGARVCAGRSEASHQRVAR